MNKKTQKRLRRSRRQTRRRSLKGTSHDIGFISRRRRLSRKRKSRKLRSGRVRTRRVRSSKGKQRGGIGAASVALGAWHGRPRTRCDRFFVSRIKGLLRNDLETFLQRAEADRSGWSERLFGIYDLGPTQVRWRDYGLDEILSKIISSCKKGYFGRFLKDACENKQGVDDSISNKSGLIDELFSGAPSFVRNACRGWGSGCSHHQKVVAWIAAVFIQRMKTPELDRWALNQWVPAAENPSLNLQSEGEAGARPWIDPSEYLLTLD